MSQSASTLASVLTSPPIMTNYLQASYFLGIFFWGRDSFLSCWIFLETTTQHDWLYPGRHTCVSLNNDWTLLIYVGYTLSHLLLIVFSTIQAKYEALVLNDIPLPSRVKVMLAVSSDEHREIILFSDSRWTITSSTTLRSSPARSWTMWPACSSPWRLGWDRGQSSLKWASLSEEQCVNSVNLCNLWHDA